jgi:hypothetical protein
MDMLNGNKIENKRKSYVNKYILHSEIQVFNLNIFKIDIKISETDR